MTDYYRMRPATLADWPGIAALDQEIFGAYGAQEEPAIIRSRLVTFPQGCAVLEGACGDGRPFIAGYLTTEKWAELREPALDEDPQESHRPDGRVLNITTLAVAPACQNQGLGARLLDHAPSHRAAGGLQADHPGNGPRRTVLSASPVSTNRRTDGERDQDGDHGTGPGRSQIPVISELSFAGRWQLQVKREEISQPAAA